MQRHHFVPEWFFRLFNGRGNAIHLIRTHDGKAIRKPAAIKGQCFRWDLYGSPEVEESLCKIEATHAAAIRDIVERAEAKKEDLASGEIVAILREACLLLRLRNPHRCQMYVDAFAEMDAAARPTTCGDGRTPQPETAAKAVSSKSAFLVQILSQVVFALTSEISLRDLECVVLRNTTTVPFIFGDCPVAFCNPYLQHIRHFGVLGFQCPGLQVLLPISPSHYLLLFDSGAYDVPSRQGFLVDVTHGSDVAQLNALQMRHAMDAVYFHDVGYADAYETLMAVHRQEIQPSRIAVRQGLLTEDNKHNESTKPLLHMFEQHTTPKLSLTCVRPWRTRHQIDSNAVRSPDLVQLQEQMHRQFSLSNLIKALRQRADSGGR